MARKKHAVGKALTNLIIIGMIGVSFITLPIVELANNSTVAPSRLVRFALTITLVYGIFVGSPLARWVLAALTAFAGISTVVYVIPLMSKAPTQSAAQLAIAFFYLSTSVLLAFPSPVSRYMKALRATR
jgi:hypothetical protein